MELGQIGSGGYANVIGRGDVAVKRVPIDKLDSIVREVIFTRCCAHPCIISFDRAVVPRGDPVFTIEMRRYPYDLLKYKCRGIADVFAIGYQLLCAVEHIHGAGIIHCDIKPANILIEPGPVPRPVLCDFGIAMRIDERVHVGLIQTADYRAPEVDGTRRQAKYSTAVDVWSVGVTLLEIIMMRHPAGIRSAGDVDSTTYACAILGRGSDIPTREGRLHELKSMRVSEISERVASLLRCESGSLLVRSGFCNLIALMLLPRRRVRSAANTLVVILDKIIRREFPEIAANCSMQKKNGSAHAITSLQIRAPGRTLDDMECLINIPEDIVMGFSTECLRYAEYLYQIYSARRGLPRHDIKLGCVYIAGVTYCGCKYSAICRLLDSEQLSAIACEIIAVIA